MDSQAGQDHDVDTNPCRKELYAKLWELHRCNGSSPVGGWKLIDQGFLSHFLAQFEKVRQRVGISEEEVLEAVTSIKTAAADARKSGNETKLYVPASGTSRPKCGTIYKVGLICGKQRW